MKSPGFLNTLGPGKKMTRGGSLRFGAIHRADTRQLYKESWKFKEVALSLRGELFAAPER
jgi:hypothetical protein